MQSATFIRWCERPSACHIQPRALPPAAARLLPPTRPALLPALLNPRAQRPSRGRNPRTHAPCFPTPTQRHHAAQPPPGQGGHLQAAKPQAASRRARHGGRVLHHPVRAASAPWSAPGHVQGNDHAVGSRRAGSCTEREAHGAGACAEEYVHAHAATGRPGPAGSSSATRRHHLK